MQTLLEILKKYLIHQTIQSTDHYRQKKTELYNQNCEM